MVRSATCSTQLSAIKWNLKRSCVRTIHHIVNDQSTTHPAPSVPPQPQIYRIKSLLKPQHPQDPRTSFLRNNCCDLGWDGHNDPRCANHAKQAICETCNSAPAHKQIRKRLPELKGFRDCHIKSFCRQCAQNDHRIDKDGYIVPEDRIEKWAAYSALSDAQSRRLRIMLDYVKAQSAEEKVPIAYFIKIATFYSDWSTELFRRDLVYHLREYLGVEKVKNKYVCSKQGVDAMDFELWYGLWNNTRRRIY